MDRTSHFWSGTSGLVLTEPNKKFFPPEYQGKSRLHYYASQWNSIEVNSSFYKIPRVDTYNKWRDEVPKEFRFAVKLWRGITHVKNFNFDERDLRKFFDALRGLKNKNGCLLIQFPASVKWNIKGLGNLLDSIKTLDPECRIAVEFRHKEWYRPDIYEIMDEFEAALVLHDMPGSKPLETNAGSPFVYYRFHGERGDYKGSYTEEILRCKSLEIQKWLEKGRDVYCFFNNTIGNALGNLLTLNDMTHLQVNTGTRLRQIM